MPEELEIESLVYRGYGLGRRQGKVWFVPYTAPGDRITASVKEERKNLVFGRMESLVDPGPDRIDPACPWFGRCGGCHWQHLPYSRQLLEKKRILGEFLFPHFPESFDRIRLIASPKIWNYRSRIQLHWDGKGRPGFFAGESREIVPVSRCGLAREELNAKIAELVSGRGPEEFFRGVELAVREKNVLLLPLGGENGENTDERLFSQVNPEVNLLLRAELFQLAEKILDSYPGKKLSVLDLFCGDGNLSLPLAPLAERIRGWDSSAGAVKLANEEGESRGNIRYFPLSVEKAKKYIKKEAEKTASQKTVPLLILDPPRRGIKGLMDFLLSLEIPNILYVSCSPPDLARDLRAFEAKGWELREIFLPDMFPQTYHIETLARLQKNPDKT